MRRAGKRGDTALTTLTRPEKGVRDSTLFRSVTEGAIASFGVALVICAAGASQPWLDRHFLPSFSVARPWYVRIETTVRLVSPAPGAALPLFPPPISRSVTPPPPHAV